MKIPASRVQAIKDREPYYRGRNKCIECKSFIKFTKTGKCSNCSKDENNYMKLQKGLRLYTHYLFEEDIPKVQSYVQSLLKARGFIK